jgi:hypothetical protein
MNDLNNVQQAAVLKLLHALIDQDAARVIVPAYEPRAGFWFGGGNLTEDDAGTLWLVGRYRNFGDSRTGLGAGERGLECALFRSTDRGASFEKVRRWSKTDLTGDYAEVLSIEGTALNRLGDGSWELFVSTERARDYPEEYAGYQKPGTGVWGIERLRGASPDTLDATTLQSVLDSNTPEALHVKDPSILTSGDAAELIFCSHPISWASSNTGLATRASADEQLTVRSWQLVPRGTVWDVAVTRVTGSMHLPRSGVLADAPAGTILFYDGAESLRQLDENPNALKRPRGFSCEELGGAMWAPQGVPGAAQRLSATAPLFLSPHGFRTSRYVSVLETADGLRAIWQQSQPDGSQPLVMNELPSSAVTEILAS